MDINKEDKSKIISAKELKIEGQVMNSNGKM